MSVKWLDSHSSSTQSQWYTENAIWPSPIPCWILWYESDLLGPSLWFLWNPPWASSIAKSTCFQQSPSFFLLYISLITLPEGIHISLVLTRVNAWELLEMICAKHSVFYITTIKMESPSLWASTWNSWNQSIPKHRLRLWGASLQTRHGGKSNRCSRGSVPKRRVGTKALHSSASISAS